MLVLDLRLAVCTLGPVTSGFNIEGSLLASCLFLHDLCVDKVLEVPVELQRTIQEVLVALGDERAHSGLGVLALPGKVLLYFGLD